MAKELIRIVVDDTDRKTFEGGMAEAQNYIARGYKIITVTSATAGNDSRWIRHFVWLQKSE